MIVRNSRKETEEESTTPYNRDKDGKSLLLGRQKLGQRRESSKQRQGL